MDIYTISGHRLDTGEEINTEVCAGSPLEAVSRLQTRSRLTQGTSLMVAVVARPTGRMVHDHFDAQGVPFPYEALESVLELARETLRANRALDTPETADLLDMLEDLIVNFESEIESLCVSDSGEAAMGESADELPGVSPSAQIARALTLARECEPSTAACFVVDELLTLAGPVLDAQVTAIRLPAEAA